MRPLSWGSTAWSVYMVLGVLGISGPGPRVGSLAVLIVPKPRSLHASCYELGYICYVLHCVDGCTYTVHQSLLHQLLRQSSFHRPCFSMLLHPTKNTSFYSQKWRELKPQH